MLNSNLDNQRVKLGDESSSGFVVDLRKVASEGKPILKREFQELKTKALKAKKNGASLIKNIDQKSQDFLKAENKKIAAWREEFSWRHFLPPMFLGQFKIFTTLAEIIRLSERKYLKIYRQSLQEEYNRLLRTGHLSALKEVLKKGRFGSEIRSTARVKFKKPALELFYFILVLFLIALPFKVFSYMLDIESIKGRIVERSHSAIVDFLAGASAAASLDAGAANARFASASQEFIQAQEEASHINDSLLALAALSSDPKIKMAAEGKKLLRSGAAAAELGQNLSAAFASLLNHPDRPLTQSLLDFSNFGHLALKNAIDLETNLAAVNQNNIPVEYQAQFQDIVIKSKALRRSLETFLASTESLNNFLGLAQDKRYLLVFQNNTELRASGGFLGSYALVDIKNGKIKNLEVPGGGSYDTEAGLKENIIAPEPLWLVNPKWHFWDANWWADWPTTAKNLMWFYEKSDGPTVDGVISFTPTVIERLLEVTGPIDLQEEYGLTIDASNFWEAVQTVVEKKDQGKTLSDQNIKTKLALGEQLTLGQDLERNSANKPKKIIGDLLAKILEVLPAKLNKDNLIKIILLSEQSLSEKQILFYFSDQKLEEIVASHNWAGQILPTSSDYLLVVNTNIAGQKSDRRMKEKIEHNITISSDGSIIDNLRITRTHSGAKNEAFSGVRNVDWLRVYVPLGSKLLAADGFEAPDAKYFSLPEKNWQNNPFLERGENIYSLDPESNTKIYQENGKTVFANWLMVDPGTSATITLSYRLPFNLFNRLAKSEDDRFLSAFNRFFGLESPKLFPYSLLVQKQPGALASEFSSHLNLGGLWSNAWAYPEAISITPSGWQLSSSLNSDKYFAVIIKK